uniref:Uncharacterized protein n=1 Tax=Plectus sambesii TaxID=2011161 RepID=A0A914XH16_9BILA
MHFWIDRKADMVEVTTIATTTTTTTNRLPKRDARPCVMRDKNTTRINNSDVVLSFALSRPADANQPRPCKPPIWAIVSVCASVGQRRQMGVA